MGAGWETVKGRATLLWQKVMAHKVISGVVTTALTGAAVAGWNLAIDKAGEVVSRDDRVIDATVTVLAGELGFVVGLPDGEPPVDDWERTEDGDFGPIRWAHAHGGAELDSIRRRIVLEAVDDTTVVTGIHAEIVERRAELPVVVDASTFATFADVEVAGIDLDRDDLTALRYEPLGENPFGKPFFEGRTLSLAAGVPETIDLWVVTDECECDFELVLDLVADGKRRQQVVRDVDGRPFRIATRQSEGAYEPSLCTVGGADVDGLVWNGAGASPGSACVPFATE